MYCTFKLLHCLTALNSSATTVTLKSASCSYLHGVAQPAIPEIPCCLTSSLTVHKKPIVRQCLPSASAELETESTRHKLNTLPPSPPHPPSSSIKHIVLLAIGSIGIEESHMVWSDILGILEKARSSMTATTSPRSAYLGLNAATFSQV